MINLFRKKLNHIILSVNETLHTMRNIKLLYKIIVLTFFCASPLATFADAAQIKAHGIHLDDLVTYFSSVDLKKHDAEFAGHAVAHHVGKSHDWLSGRLSCGKYLRFASSYTDIDTANKTVQEIIVENADKIGAWLKKGEKEKFIVSKQFKEKIGVLLSKKDMQFRDCTAGIVVLKRSKDDKHKFYVLTSYPVLKVNEGEFEQRKWQKTNHN